MKPKMRKRSSATSRVCIENQSLWLGEVIGPFQVARGTREREREDKGKERKKKKKNNKKKMQNTHEKGFEKKTRRQSVAIQPACMSNVSFPSLHVRDVCMDL